MTTAVLKEYIRRVYELETAMYSRQKLREMVAQKIYALEHTKYEGYKHKESYDLGERVLTILVVTGIVFLAVVFFWFFVGLVAEIIRDVDWGETFPKAILVTMLISFVISALYIDIPDIIDTIKWNRSVEPDNRAIDARNQQKKQMVNYQLAELNKCLQIIDMSIRETKNTLNRFYQCNIVYSKYRNFIAISAFHDYLQSGKCSTLTGHEGAYTIYDIEVRLDKILQKLDVIISQLEQIKQNQYTLYCAIKESDRRNQQFAQRLFSSINSMQDLLFEINQNTAISAYYNSVTAKNSECMKWLTYMKLY